MDKENVVYTYMAYYSVLKKKEIQQYATMWMNLEGVMLNEINQSQKYTVRFHLYKIPKIAKFVEA